jgi:cation transport ATPase
MEGAAPARDPVRTVGKEPRGTLTLWLPVIAGLIVALALGGLILAAWSPWRPARLWSLLLQNHWLIAAISVLACFGLGREVAAEAWRDLGRLNLSGIALVELAVLAALTRGILVGLADADPERLGMGLSAYALACGLVAAVMLGRRVIAGRSMPRAAWIDSAANQPVAVPPGNLIPFDGVIVSGRSEVDEGPIGGALIGALRIAGDTVRRGARNGDNELIIEPLAVSPLPPPAFAAAPAFVPGFSRKAGLIFAASLILALAVALIRGGTGMVLLENALLAFAMAVPVGLGVARPLVYGCARSRAQSMGWLLNGSSAVAEMAEITALVCGRGGVLARTELEIVALHPAIGVEPAELMAAATSMTQSSHSTWARTLAHYAVARKMLLVPISDWSAESHESGFGFRARTQGGQRLAAGSRDWIAAQGIRTYVLEAQERESLLPGRRALWVAQLSPHPILIGVIVAGERLKPGAAEMCKNAKRLGFTTVLLDRRGVEGGAELARALGLRLVEDDPMARKAMATEWETLGLRAAIAQHRGDPAPQSPTGPRLLLGARFAADPRRAVEGGWSAATERRDPRLVLDLVRLARETRRRERFGYFLAYVFSLPGLWIAATGADLPQVVVLAPLVGLLGLIVNAQLLRMMPATAGEIDEE